MAGTRSLNVQYGCGLSAPGGWRNFDASPTLRLQRLPLAGRWIARGRANFPDNVEFGDVIGGLPVESGSCAHVYCSHVLEHLSLDDLRVALGETRRILAPGGVFRGVLPDLEHYIRCYSDDPTPEAAPNFMRETLLGAKSRDRGVKGLLEAFLGNHRHLWMWDYKSLSNELKAAGFVDIRRARFGDSGIAAFDAVEDESRWNDCLGFQCRRAAQG